MKIRQTETATDGDAYTGSLFNIHIYGSSPQKCPDYFGNTYETRAYFGKYLKEK